MHVLGGNLGGEGRYLTSIVSMMLVSTVAFCAFGLVIIGFGLVYFNTSGFDAVNALLTGTLLAIIGVLVWAHVIAYVLIQENYDLGARKAALVVAACIIPTLVLGFAAFAGWVLTLFAVVSMVSAMWPS